MKLSNKGSRKRTLLLVGSLLCLVALGHALGQQYTDPGYIGSEMCASCHQEISEQFTHSIHSRLASFELSGGIPGCSVRSAANQSFKLSPGSFGAQQMLFLCLECRTRMATEEK